ncbi:hypothetical protein Tco_0881918 [Tanacetum coccineum]
MKNKEHDEGTKKPGNISKTVKLANEEFMTTKPTVSLKYPEWIHFATKCMIKGTYQGHWDDIWYISSNTNMHLCSKLNLFCNIKESFAVSKLDDQMKFLFTYGIGEVVVKNGDERSTKPLTHGMPHWQSVCLHFDPTDENKDPMIARIEGLRFRDPGGACAEI